ncbi:MAG: RNA methyltransferase [Flavicella sp.]|nr:RNA methyltransferase [Flavicella sp.]
MELSKNKIKLIKSLDQKKQRLKHQLFVAEGKKVVQELLTSSLECEALFVTKEMELLFENESYAVITELDLKKITSLKSPNGVLALFKIPAAQQVKTEGLIVALDAINDPGNLGTIIRLCDWFGVEQLVCSENTVDCFNSKVVQSTMGSLSRVSIVYLPLAEYLQNTDLSIFCADMEGQNVYQSELPSRGILVMGNEANGVSEEIENLCTDKIMIPRFGKVQETESLNVATATAILLSEFQRKSV